MYEPGECTRLASPLAAWSGATPLPSTPHLGLSPAEQAPIVSRAGCVFTCAGICVFVVTGALNSTVLARPDRQVLEGLLAWD